MRSALRLDGSALVAALALCVLSACTASRPPVVRVPLAAEWVRFLPLPDAGCGPMAGARGSTLEDLHRTLIEDRASAPEVRRLALDNAAFGPAWRVLAAQAATVGDLAVASEEAARIHTESPDCAAAWLLAGRLDELAGRPVPALEKYLRARPNPAASERVDALRPLAVSALTRSIDDAIASRRFDDAEAAYQTLESIGPPAAELARAEAALAGARGDKTRELSALRRLRPNPLADEAGAERWADLELERGDPSTGVRLLEEIVRRHPGEPNWTARLARAKFAWRLTLLPDAVQQVAARPQLTRGDLAVVLFWVAPGIRHARATASIIATDVVDHPFREEIVRTVNLGLLRIDEVLRSFAPTRAAQRGEALEAVLRARLLAAASSAGAGNCPDPAAGLPAREAVCRLAVECGLISDPAGCLPGAPVSGPEVTAWIADLFASQEAMR